MFRPGALDSLTGGFTPVRKREFPGDGANDQGSIFHTSMQEIIPQLGGLLLGSLPTLILFIFLVLCYQFLVQGPLTRTLKERRARTTGAVEEAHKAIAKAE